MFEVASDTTAPENTTVSTYSVIRIGENVQFTAGYSETRRAWTILPIDTAADANADGKFEVLRSTKMMLNPQSLVGMVLSTSQGGVVGTVVSVAVESVDVSPINLLGQQLAITLGEHEGLDADTPVMLQYPTLNFFGNQVNIPASNGRSWQLTLNSTMPAQANRMQLMLFRIQFTAIKLAFAAANVSKTDQEIQEIVIEMAAAGNNLDSLIASEMETLEKDRRSRAFTSANTLANAPQF